ncbi:cysteine desulfurase family protein [Leifsonia sp. Leaf264]|uniref:cysteine desulfurase family protein n=1 Tax=Leifsonia sp. Leaf264 TaxID=1736314 RepID=UPI0006F640EA|nr:cysteine desulfurase family protein [Leifsonia sp. Leaf264]KQP01974.1 cysteine desulfurase [Leifsonia sp. Leaf264]
MAVYLDHAATTPMSGAAISAYVEAMALVGNPSSIHSQGQNARRLLEESREQVASTLGCDPIEVVFTGNGTEAINLAIKGLYWARPGNRILVPGGEHHATIDTVEWLERHEGAVIEWLPLDAIGRVRLDALEEALATDAASIALVSMLWANNEVGTVQPVAEIATLAARYGVPLHLDAVAAYGHVGISFAELRAASRAAPGVGLVALSVSAHKIGGPVGIGALVLSRTATLEPLIHGGGQQRQVRSGTQDVAAAVSFAAASGAVIPQMEAESARVEALRWRLVSGVVAAVPAVVVNGDGDAAGRLPGTAHFAFPGCQGDSLLFLLDAAGVSVSTGSACQAGIPEPSHVLLAMGRDDETARSALRVTLGRTTTEADVDAFVAALPAAYAQAARAGLAGRATSFDR